MRFRSAHHQAPTIGKINVTPLIDVVMVLIVFYLIVGKLASDRAAAVQLPGTAVGTASESGGGVVIAVTADGGELGAGTVLMDGAPVVVSGLADALRARLPADGSGSAATPVQIRADRRLSYAAVAPIVDACRSVGLTSLKLVTTREGGAASGGGGAP